MNTNFGLSTIPAFDRLIPTVSAFDGLTGLLTNPSLAGSTINITSTASYDKSIVTGINNDYIRAGLGNDTITGGTGADTFAFGSPIEGIDTITDFSIEQGDKIQISGAGFGTTDFNRFSYNAATGGLFFDTTQLAVLPINLSVTPANLTIV